MIAHVARRNATSWIAAVVIAATGLYVWRPDFSAQWGIIDDHEIVQWLGSDGSMSVAEIPARLMQTEVGRWGRSPRFRPSYYLLHLLETALWGDNPGCWYAFRVAIFVGCCLLAFSMLREWIGAVAATLFVLIVMGENYWADVFARLGPAETYAVLGSAVYAFGLQRFAGALRRGPPRQRGMWLEAALMVGGAFLAMGSKENFLFIPVFNLALFSYAYVKKRVDRVLVVSTLMVLAYAFFIAGAVAVALVATGRDVYANDVSLGSRSLLVMRGFKSAVVAFRLSGDPARLCALAIAGAGLGFVLLKRTALREYLRALFGAGAVLALLICFYVLQYVFYNGAWPMHGRYDVPGLLAVPFFWLMCMALLVRYVALMGGGPWQIRVARALLALLCVSGIQPGEAWAKWREVRMTGVGTGVAAALKASEPMATYARLRQKAELNRTRTVQFTSTIREIAAECRRRPTSPVLFESYDPWDFERVASTRRFLLAYEVSNVMFLRVNGYSPATVKPGLEQGLAQTLIDVSLGAYERSQPEGTPEGELARWMEWGFAPLAKLNAESEAIVVSFSRGPSGTGKQFRVDW